MITLMEPSVNTNYQNANLRAKAAQLVMIDIPSSTLSSDDVAHLSSHPWNGVLMFAHNIQNREQIKALLCQITSICPGAPLFTIDQEGGLVDRIRFVDSVLSPGNMALAATGRVEDCQLAHQILGQQLRELGFHLDFSPCIDVNNNPDNPIVGVRSFGEDPQRVAQFGVAAVKGLQAGGVAATAKHFPGHGDSALDSHLALPTIPHSRERLDAVEFVPFRAAIEAGVDAVMTAHITFPALDPRPGLPATLSYPILTTLLREEFGFDGVIFTDSLAMQAVADHFGIQEAAVRSLEAGADIVLACGTYADHLAVVNAIVSAVESGRLAMETLDKALARIQKLKDRWLGAPPSTLSLSQMQQQMSQVAQRSITVVRKADNLPVAPGSKVIVLSPDLLPVTPLGEMASSELTLSHLVIPGASVTHQTFPHLPESVAIHHTMTLCKSFDVVVLNIYARDRLADSQRELLEKLHCTVGNLIVVSLSSPYLMREFPQVGTYVSCFNYTPLSLQALGQVLGGVIEPQGNLPVTIPQAGHTH